MSSSRGPGSGFAPSPAPDLTLWAPLNPERRRDPWASWGAQSQRRGTARRGCCRALVEIRFFVHRQVRDLCSPRARLFCRLTGLDGGAGAAAHPPNGTWGWGDAPRAPNGMASGSEEKEEERDVRSAENTSLFSSFQHVAVGLAFAKGRPFRQPLDQLAYLFMGAVTATSSFLLCPVQPLHQFLELTCSPSEWRVTLLALALGHFLRSAFLEASDPGKSCTPSGARSAPAPSAPRRGLPITRRQTPEIKIAIETPKKMSHWT
ncbi:unnamed protein product [Natator depressus]